MISMFEPRVDSGNSEEDVRNTISRQLSDNDRGLEPQETSYVVKNCHGRKQEDVFESKVKFTFEDNLKEEDV